MSIGFNEPMNDAARKMLKEIYGNPVAEDEKTMLFDQTKDIEQRDMKAVANAAGQPATVELHALDEIKTMSDGRKYRVTPNGWKRITD